MEFIKAQECHFADIANLVSTPEEFFLVYPSGTWPWTVAQIEELAANREGLTVGIVDGEVAAFADLYNVKPGQSAFIGNVIVTDKFKGRGVGKALMLYMVELIKKSYEAVPYLSVFTSNTRALLLYRKLGFMPFDVESRTGINNEQTALIHMRYDN